MFNFFFARQQTICLIEQELYFESLIEQEQNAVLSISYDIATSTIFFLIVLQAP